MILFDVLMPTLGDEVHIVSYEITVLLDLVPAHIEVALDSGKFFVDLAQLRLEHAGDGTA